MLSVKNLFLLAILCITSIKSFSGTIKGFVNDKTNGEPIIGAVVMLEGTKYGTATGLDGSFTMRNIPSGTYELEIRFASFEAYKQHIVLSDTQTIVINHLLAPLSATLGEVEVKGKLKNGSDEQARNIEKNSDNVVNIVSARTIELLPDITIANVLQRVSGVTVQRNSNGDARYAVIRGMDKRYNYTLVNGIKIPSPDDKMRYVPMDIFPAEMVDRVEVIKTLTPGMEGDAIGGVMNLVMKNAPDRFVFYASAATGYNQTMLDRKFEGFPKSGPNLKDPIELHGANYSANLNDFQKRTGDFKDIQAPANGLLSLTIGDRFLKDKKLGAIFSGSYQNTFKGSDNIFFLSSIQPGENNAPAITNLQIRKYSTQERRTGLHSKIDYEFNKRNSLSLYGLYLQLNELQTRDVIDTTVQINRIGAGTGPVDFTKRAAFRTQVIENLTLQGKHLLMDNLKLDYSLVYSRAKMDVPDMTELHTTANAYIDTLTGKSVATPQNFKSFKHSWERTQDEDHAAYLNVTYTPSLFGKETEFMAGGMYRNKARSNYYNDYSLSSASPSQPFSTIYGANMVVTQPTGDVNNTLNYTVTEDIAAYYGQAKVIFGKLQVLGGVRVEQTHQKYAMNVDPDLVAGQNGEFKYTDVLPSVHLKYALSAKENLRFSYFESITRPGFFEIVPYQFNGEYYDEVGNDSLNHTVAHNFDIRYEWFPKGIDQVLVGAFYKNITNPIEYLLAPKPGKASAGELMPQNVSDKPATNYGAEIVIAKYFHYFGVSANYTYTNSSITTTKLSRLRDSATGQIKNFTVSDTRPLQGQSAHVANLALIYKNPTIGFDAHLSWVYTGRRIAFLSAYEGLDYWQRATSFFDFSCEKRIVKHISVYAKVNNILNTSVIMELMKSKEPFITGTYQLPYQTLKSNTLVEKDSYGRNYLIGIRYKLD
jgi:outer membrane cobalamin receptor